MRKKGGFTIFWPQYFDKNRPIRLGRRVSKEIATDKPLVEDLYKAAIKVKYAAEIDHQSKYPRSPYDSPGLVLIDTMGQKKSFVLKKLAPEVIIAKKKRLDSAKLDKFKKKHKKKKDKSELLKAKIKKRHKK